MPAAERTLFLNVDLDLYSRYDLSPLVNALGRKVAVLYLGRERGRYSAHLELAKHTKSADSTIWAFCRIIQSFSERERAMWGAVTLRSFSVGVQAGTEPASCDFVIRARTAKAAAALGAQIALTVYAPERS